MLSSVIVTYNPQVRVLLACVDSLQSQCDSVIIIDNASSVLIESIVKQFSKCLFVPLNSNIGIGSAQNLGIQRAIANGSDYILLSDQDTIFPYNYSENMLKCLAALSQCSPVAAVCPNFYDENRAELCPVHVESFTSGFKKKIVRSGFHKVSFSNASGMFFPVNAFSNIGFMREDLFIDCVDTEWCLRAKKLGFSVYCNANVQITHSLGDNVVLFMGRVVTQHALLRHYYIARNSVYLALHSRYLVLNQRFYFVLYALKRLFGHALLSSPRLNIFQNGLRGIWHGIIGKLGKHE